MAQTCKSLFSSLRPDDRAQRGLNRAAHTWLKKEVLAFLLIFHVAAADTGVRALDEAAIQAKAPDRVFLDAITRAGNRLVAAGQHGVIITSDDNGLTWQQAAVPVNVEITAISFASPSQGWAVGHYGVILHTQDAGATWQIQLNGLQANRLTQAAAQAAVTANDPSPGTPLALKRADHFVTGGADKPFLTIWAQSPQDAIVFGAYRMAMKTTDGGKDWSDWSLHISDAYSHNLYDAAAVGSQIYIAAETGLIFRSTDGGNSFAEIPPPGTATLFGVLGTGENFVLAFGVAGQAFLSKDGGQSWEGVAFGTSDNLMAAKMLSDGSIVVANEDGTLYRSTDNGQSFVPLQLAIPMAVFDLAQAPDGGVILAGNGGILRVPLQDFKPN
jgi:photosystem II stability/assembly factor-like uncharacterized protein